MLPARSTARLGIKRWMTLALSGSQVVACVNEPATVPPVTFAWYQRGAANPEVFCRRTVCGTHSDSVPPILVYWFCTMARICSTSIRFVVSGCGALATLALGQLVAASGTSGPVNVESDSLFQSTWNL